MKILEIVCLENGDVVLVEATEEEAAEEAVQDGHDLGAVTRLPSRRSEDTGQPLVSIRFSSEVRDMLGEDMLGVAEAMIEAATAYMSDETHLDASELLLGPGLELNGDLNGELDGELRKGSGLKISTDRMEADLDDFEDQVSTAPVVLH